MSPEFQIDSSHLLLIGAGSGVGAAVVRRFGRESFRTLVARGEKLQPVAAALRQEGIVVDTLVADASDLDTYRSSTSSAASSPHRSLRRDARCPRRTILFTGGGFADYPVPALASLSLGKAALRSAATLIAGEVASDGVQAASITIAGQVAPGTAFDLAPKTRAAGQNKSNAHRYVAACTVPTAQISRLRRSYAVSVSVAPWVSAPSKRYSVCHFRKKTPHGMRIDAEAGHDRSSPTQPPREKPRHAHQHPADRRGAVR